MYVYNISIYNTESKMLVGDGVAGNSRKERGSTSKDTMYAKGQGPD